MNALSLILRGGLFWLAVLGCVIRDSLKYQRVYGILDFRTLLCTFVAAFAILLGIGYWYNWWGTAKRFPEGCCRRCGYDLRGNVSGRCPECGRAVNPIADGIAFSATAPGAEQSAPPSTAERESLTSQILRNVLPPLSLGSPCCYLLLFAAWHFGIFGKATHLIVMPLLGLFAALQVVYAVYRTSGTNKPIKARPFLLLGLMLLALALLLLLLLFLFGRVFDSALTP